MVNSGVRRIEGAVRGERGTAKRKQEGRRDSEVDGILRYVDEEERKHTAKGASGKDQIREFNERMETD